MKRLFKTAVAFTLIFSLIFPCFALRGFCETQPLKITVAADTHFQCAADLGEPDSRYSGYLLDPETYGYASTQGQMNYESEAILNEMLSEFSESDSEYLLIAGDLTCGKRQSHMEFAEYLRKTEMESGKQIFVIIGNHDCDSESSENKISMEEFRGIYAEFGYDEAISRHSSSASYTADLNGDYRLIAIDSCIYGEDDGRISSGVFRWIREQTEQAEKDGKTLIAMMHHSILPHYELQPMIDLWQFYAGWFADHGINTVFTGHIHANDISSSISDCGNAVYDIQTGALISSPNTYRTAVFSADGIEIESRFITHIDTSLLPEQLTTAQKAKLEEDFGEYAKEYFISGTGKWLDRNIGSVNRLERWFGLKEGTKAYEAADKLMKTLGAAVGQDIYNTGEGQSIEETLSAYGISVPESEYIKPYQVAAKLMYGFFYGDEDAVGNEREVRLLLKCLEGAVLSAMKSGLDDSVLSALITAVTGEIPPSGSLSSPKGSHFLLDAAEKTALALLETLTGGFIDDYSAPGDLNVTIPAEISENSAPLHFLARIMRLFAEFIKRLFGHMTVT